MPIIKSAKKALRQNKKHFVLNQKKKSVLKALVKKTSKSKAKKDLSLLYSTVDKAVKNKIIHKNKARRIKSRIAKLSSKKS
jgi:small subunit ribosomal protein S20